MSFCFTRPPWLENKRHEGVEYVVKDYEDYDGGPDIEYSVHEMFNSEAVKLPRKEPTIEEILSETDVIGDQREPALELSKGEVRVHYIKCVEIDSDTFSVRRSKLDRKDFREFKAF